MICSEVDPTVNDCDATAVNAVKGVSVRVGVKVIVDADVAPTIPRFVKVAVADPVATTAVVPINEPPPAVIDAVTVYVPTAARTPELLVSLTTG